MSTAKPTPRPKKKTPSAAYKAGLAMRAKVLGPDYVQKAFDNANDLNMPFQEVATEFAWGSVWTRPGLSLRDRSLATLSMCIALNRPAELRIHLRGAIRNGITRTELRDSTIVVVAAAIILGLFTAISDFSLTQVVILFTDMVS